MHRQLRSLRGFECYGDFSTAKSNEAPAVRECRADLCSFAFISSSFDTLTLCRDRDVCQMGVSWRTVRGLRRSICQKRSGVSLPDPDWVRRSIRPPARGNHEYIDWFRSATELWIQHDGRVGQICTPNGP